MSEPTASSSDTPVHNEREAFGHPPPGRPEPISPACLSFEVRKYVTEFLMALHPDLTLNTSTCTRLRLPCQNFSSNLGKPPLTLRSKQRIVT